MVQQLLGNIDHRLRDTVPITIWSSRGLGLVTDKKNKSRAEQEPRSAHGRAVKKPEHGTFENIPEYPGTDYNRKEKGVNIQADGKTQIAKNIKQYYPSLKESVFMA